jgi:hypothetical protein
MNFEPFDDIGSAWNAILRYRLSKEGLALAHEHAEALTGFLELDAPPLTLSQTAEYVFAHRTQLTETAPRLLALAARCAHYAHRQFVDNLGGPRGRAIAETLRRDSGEEADPRQPWPDPRDDPEARPEFARDSGEGVTL